MFDVAFSELVVIALVALIVIGPERLPQVARTVGHLWSRLQRYVTTVKNDISNEIDLEEARKMKQSLIQQATVVEQEVRSAQLTVEQQVLQAYHRKSAAEPVSKSSLLDTTKKPQ